MHVLILHWIKVDALLIFGVFFMWSFLLPKTLSHEFWLPWPLQNLSSILSFKESTRLHWAHLFCTVAYKVSQNNELGEIIKLIFLISLLSVITAFHYLMTNVFKLGFIFCWLFVVSLSLYSFTCTERRSPNSSRVIYIARPKMYLTQCH
jgi:hypothetical protein